MVPTPLSPGKALGPQQGLAHGPSSGLAYICEGLKEQKKGLETLVLWNNQLTHTGMAFLGVTLVSQTGRGRAPSSASLVLTLHRRDPSQASLWHWVPSLSFPSLSVLREIAFLTLSWFSHVWHHGLVSCCTQGENVLHRKLNFLEAFSTFYIFLPKYMVFKASSQATKTHI